MADSMLNLGGALIILASIMAGGLLVLWLLIRPHSSITMADRQQSHCDDEDALELQSTNIVP